MLYALQDFVSTREVVENYRGVFSRDSFDIGYYKNLKHKIETQDHPPMFLKPYHIPWSIEEKVERKISELLEHGIIVECSSAWNSPIVPIRKKNGDLRLCIDYRKVNSVTTKKSFLTPDFQQIVDCLSEAKFFSTLDLCQGYYQIPLDENDRLKSAFTTKSGQFCFTRMPFGLSGAPATFQRAMAQVFRNINWEKCVIFMDDILVFGKTIEEHDSNLSCVLQALQQNELKVSPSKCDMLKKEVQFLGHIIDGNGIRTDPNKTKAMQNYPIPKNVKELQRFLGMCNYYRRFIKGFAELARPLHELTSKKHKKFEWKVEHEDAFIKLKNAMLSPPILSFPNKFGKFILHTDASGFAIGSVLCQIQHGEERVIAYGSRKLSETEQRYGVTRKEMLSVVFFVKQFKHYLWGVPFEIRCDHQALVPMLKTATEGSQQFYRWKAELDQYDFEIKYVKGSVNVLADAMSRITETLHEPLMSIQDQDSKDEVNDTIIKLLKEDKKKMSMPNEIRALNQSGKIIWARREELLVIANRLYLVTANGNKRLILPFHRRISVARDLHRQCGHLGIQKCLQLLKNRFYWPRMEETVNSVVNACELCAREKNKYTRDKAPLCSTVTGEPFERIAVDICGPFNITPRGNRFILGITDQFSKFCSLIPLKDTSAQSVARALFECWISQFGAPVEIMSDNGAAFKSSLKSQLCLLMGIKETFSPPYFPQANGQAERLFRTTKCMMKLIIRDYKCHWDETLATINLAIRNSKNKATGFTPFEILFGRRARLPIDWQFYDKTQSENLDVSMGDYVISLTKILHDVQRHARHHLAMEIQKQADYYNKKNLYRKLKIGDLVLVRTTRQGYGLQKYKYNGPFKINNKLGEWTYEILNQDTGEVFKRSYNQIKRYIKPLESVATPVNCVKMPIRVQRNDRLLVEGPDVTEVEELTDRLDEAVRRSVRTRIPTVRYGYDTTA